jgi:hypothetical protein
MAMNMIDLDWRGNCRKERVGYGSSLRPEYLLHYTRISKNKAMPHYPPAQQGGIGLSGDTRADGLAIKT